MSEQKTISKPKLNEEIIVTEKAARQIKKLMVDNTIPESHGLRMGVKGGGCSGLSYILGFDAEPKPNDTIIELYGIRIYVDPKSLFFLSGTELDYQDGLNGKGFIFNNPNAAKTCGCGNSFSA